MLQSKTTIVKVWQKIIQVHIFAIHELKKVAWLHHKRHTPKSDAIGQFFLKFILQTNKPGMAMCIFAHYLCSLGANKITKQKKKIQKTPSEKNVPKCSIAYLCICFWGKEITALDHSQKWYVIGPYGKITFFSPDHLVKDTWALLRLALLKNTLGKKFPTSVHKQFLCRLSPWLN
jgi:hypothetical protein